MDSHRVPDFPAVGQGLKSGNNHVVRAIQFLTAGCFSLSPRERVG